MIARVVHHVEQHLTQNVGVRFAFCRLVSAPSIKVCLGQMPDELLQIVVNLAQTISGYFDSLKLCFSRQAGGRNSFPAFQPDPFCASNVSNNTADGAVTSLLVGGEDV